MFFPRFHPTRWARPVAVSSVKSGIFPLFAAMAFFPPMGLSSPASATQAASSTPVRYLTVAGVRTFPRVTLEPPVIDLFQFASIAVTGVAAQSVEVGLIGATDATGIAYRWTPYRWRRLRLRRDSWRGVLPAPALRGIYQLQLRLQHHIVESLPWMLEVFRPGTLTRPLFPTPTAVVRDFIDQLPGAQTVVALRSWPQAAFDHRDPRLHRIYAVAYAPIGDRRPMPQRGLFITAVRNGFDGQWRLLDATVQPYG